MGWDGYQHQDVFTPGVLPTTGAIEASKGPYTGVRKSREGPYQLCQGKVFDLRWSWYWNMDGWNAVTPRGKAWECPLSVSGLLGAVVGN